MSGNMSVFEEDLRYTALQMFQEAASVLERAGGEGDLGAMKKVMDGSLAIVYFELVPPCPRVSRYPDGCRAPVLHSQRHTGGGGWFRYPRPRRVRTRLIPG